MNDAEFDGLVAGFYRAATGALPWNQALAGVQQAFSARAACLHTLDFSDGRLLSLHAGGADMDDVCLTYIRDYHLIDPRRNRALAQGPAAFGQWMHDHEAFDDAYVARNRFFQQFLPAYGTRYNANVVLPLQGTVGTGFILELPADRGPLNADEREVARRLGLHMQDALRAHERVRALVAQVLAGHGLLNGFPYPMWLLDQTRHIAFENPAAERETQEAKRVARRGSAFTLLHARPDRTLTERLHALCRQPHGSNAVIDMRVTTADAPAWLHLSLLQPGAVMSSFGDQPQVLATLFDPAQLEPLDPFALAHMFDLTPMEAKVAARLADGWTAEQIAQAHGTAAATVRTQVRQVIQKLGASRTVDVVRMLRQGQALWAAARPT